MSEDAVIKCRAEDIGADIQGPLAPEDMALADLIAEVSAWRSGELYRGYDRIKALELPKVQAEVDRMREGVTQTLAIDDVSMSVTVTAEQRRILEALLHPSVNDNPEQKEKP